MKKNTLIFSLLIVCISLFAQEESEVFITIDGTEVSTEEFVRVYSKNNDITADSDQKGVEDYLDLFINYKLKVIEAENLGYDTVKSFVDEFSGYRDQLAKPYLENSELKEGLIKEAYERYKKEIDASHILVRCSENALPKDTLIAFKKATAIRARVLGGEPFEQVAKATSDDPSVKDNGGHLGYFSVFKMVYPFESGAYNTPKGQVSNIIRTSFGYHIIKVNDIRENRGSVKTAHIMTRINKGATEPEIKAAEEKIQKAYLALMNGMPWNEAVQKFSENPRTKKKNGEIGWLTTGQAPEVYLNPCYKLEVGQFSKPIKTAGGFHIGYVLDKKPIGSYEESLEMLTRKVENDKIRRGVLEDYKYSELKKKYKLESYPENLTALTEQIDSTIYNRTWESEKSAQLSAPVFKIEDKSFSQYDFAKFLASNKAVISKSFPIEVLIQKNIEIFQNNSLFNYALEKLPEENLDYKYLLKEYHDGILLFNLTNDVVWKKAQEDSVGLKNFYKHAKKYQWNERLVTKVFTYKNNAFTNQIPNLAKKQLKKGLDDDFIVQSLCPEDSLPCVTIKEQIFEKEKDSMYDKLSKVKGSYTVDNIDSTTYLFYVVDTKGVEEKKLDEAKGLYISDYQTYLELEWVKELKEKYTVTVNDEVLKRLSAELNN